MDDPHLNAPVLQAGVPLKQASAVLILLHGRGATADSIMDLANYIGHDGFAYLAPQANGNTWYPYSFLEPIAKNEPWLTSALRCVNRVVASVLKAGLSREKIAIAGFSQGACLTMEYGVRLPHRYGALVGLSGGVIGPPGTKWGAEKPKSLSDTPAFVGCSDVDPHIPLERVHETVAVLKALGAEVIEQIYPGMGHTINEDEMKRCKALLRKLTDS